MKKNNFIKILKSNKGSQLIEFMVLLPVMLFITFGFLILGVTIYNKVVVVDAAREACRSEALGLSSADVKVKELLKSSNLSTDDTRVTIIKESSGSYIKVKVTYKSPTLIPGLGKVVGANWGNYFDLTAYSEFKKER